MSEQPDERIRLELELMADHPNLLLGLATWQELGLISEAQLLAFCQSRLVCALPPEVVPRPVSPASDSAPVPSSWGDSELRPVEPRPVASRPVELKPGAVEPKVSLGGVEDFLAPAPEPIPPRYPSSGLSRSPSRSPRPSRDTVPVSSRPSPVDSWLQQLMGELSVVWLLGLGVFLVVLSSAVLAATQWARFSAVGQYAVLLAYTLVFWGIGRWSSSHRGLQLTSKTLQSLAILLVPLNMWAMDALGVSRTFVGFGVVAIALVLLTLISLFSLERWSATTLQRANFLGIAYLFLLGGFQQFLSAWVVDVGVIYLGMGGSALALLYDRTTLGQGSEATPGSATSDSASSDSATPPSVDSAISASANPASRNHLLSNRSLCAGLILVALGLLLLRSLTNLNPAEWGQLGLAFGLYGAALVGMSQREETAAITTAVQGTRRPPGTQGKRWLGRGLLWWAWLISVSDWPAQALGISGLGLGLRLWHLKRLERARDLLFAFVIALQLPFLAWRLLPDAWQAALVNPLANWLDTRFDPWILLGFTLFPYVIVMVAAADRFHQHRRWQLARWSEGIAIVSNGSLTVISLLSPSVLVVNLIATTATVLVTTLRRRPWRPWRVFISHSLGLITILVTLANSWPNLSSTQWLLIFFGLMLWELWLSRGQRTLWHQSAWYFGLGLAAVAYLLLLEHLISRDFQSQLSLLGLSLPLVLWGIGRSAGSLATLGLAVPLTLGLPWTRLGGLAIATALAAINTGKLAELPGAVLTLGFGLGLVVSLLRDGIPTLLPPLLTNDTDWYLVGAIVTLVLWIGHYRLSALPPAPGDHRQSLREIYGTACDRWGFVLSGAILMGLTLESGWLYSGWREAHPVYALGLGVLGMALGMRFWGQATPLPLYGLGWVSELLAVEIVGWCEGTLLDLATVTLGLGVASLGLAVGLRSRLPERVPTLHHLSLMYALLSLGLRLTHFTAWTGWLTLVAALIGLEIGRQTRQPWLRWLALVGISLGWYELVVFQLLQTSGGAATDGLIVLAGVAVVIMGGYRLSAGWLERRWELPSEEMIAAAHIHWAIGTLLMALTVALTQPGEGTLTAVGLGLMLVGYALAQGRSDGPTADLWVYLGLVGLVGWFGYGRLAYPELRVLDNWWSGVACGVGVGLYGLPWHRWGWPRQPWRRMAVLVPLAVLVLTPGFTHYPSLGIVSGFYGWLAWATRRVRISYLSVFLAIWGIWHWLAQQPLSSAMAQVTPFGLALLYIAQVDPGLLQSDLKPTRHWVRIFGMGSILGTALISSGWGGLPLAVLSLGAIALGLGLRVRAYLYIGTVVFGLNALDQLILLNTAYPFMKWVIGILVGVTLIWIAADFERRRTQWLGLAQTWSQELESWQ